MIVNAPARQAFDDLVQLAHSVRPGWQAPGIKAAIRQALNREDPFDFADLTRAVVKAALDSTAQTPAVIAHDAYWLKVAPSAVVHGSDEGDPRYVCGICSLSEGACRARAATNGHDFINRLDALRLAKPAKDDVR